MNIICLFHLPLEQLSCETSIINVFTRQEALLETAAGGFCTMLIGPQDADPAFIEEVKATNSHCIVILGFSSQTEAALPYSWQTFIDGVYFLDSPEKTDIKHNKLSASDLFQDMLSGEYINDLIYDHPERLHELQPIFKLMNIDVNPHIVLTIVFDNFWTVCERKDNAYRYRLKRTMLNSVRKVLKDGVKGVGTTLIGTDKVVVLLDCEKRSPKEAEEYADHCASLIQGAIQKQCELTVSIGISNYCSFPAFLWRAYDQSFRALESSFQMGNGQILHYQQAPLPLTGELNKSDQELFKHELIIAVSTQSRESCVHALNHLTARLALQNAGESYTKSLLVITLSEIARYCIMIGLDAAEISEKIVLIVNQIFKANTMNDIKKETLAFLYYLLDKIKSSDSDSSILNIAKAYIHQYYMEPLTLHEVAGLCGYSTAYFSRSFKEHFSINFVQYLMQIRIGSAKKLLTDSELTMSEICEKTGFQSLSYFSTTFKKEVGMAPLQFRLEHIEKD